MRAYSFRVRVRVKIKVKIRVRVRVRPGSVREHRHPQGIFSKDPTT